MPSSTEFNSWLGTLFGRPEVEVSHLLRDSTALRFLIAWSLFESKCFSGLVKAKKIDKYAKSVSQSICRDSIADAVAHFHARYQDKDCFEHLMYGQENSRLARLLEQPIDNLSGDDRAFLLVFVVYRFRNNIFHGNKPVDSWLQYNEQIQYCISAMQVFVSHAEHAAPSIRSEAA